MDSGIGILSGTSQRCVCKGVIPGTCWSCWNCGILGVFALRKSCKDNSCRRKLLYLSSLTSLDLENIDPEVAKMRTTTFNEMSFRIASFVILDLFDPSDAYSLSMLHVAKVHSYEQAPFEQKKNFPPPEQLRKCLLHKLIA